MKFWVDAQLPPQLAVWLSEQFHIEAFSLRELGLRDAADAEIFQKAQQKGIVIISKDSDFVELLSRYGSPPQLIWVSCQTDIDHISSFVPYVDALTTDNNMRKLCTNEVVDAELKQFPSKIFYKDNYVEFEIWLDRLLVEPETQVA